MKKAIVVVLSLAFVASVSFAFAEELAIRPESAGNDSQQSKEERAQARDQWKLERQQALENLKLEKETLRATFKENLAAEKCARIEEKIQERTAKFGTAKVKHMSVYNNLLSRIDKFIARFDAFNVANGNKLDAVALDKLKADRATLANMILAFQTSSGDYFTKLNATKSSTCGTAEGEFRATLTDARAYLASVHDNAAAIRSYVRETILPDLLTVKKNIASIRGEAGDETATTEEDETGENDEATTPAPTTEEDVTKPTISITSSSPAGTTFTADATVTISATAADNVGVTKVEFIDGDSLISTATAAPYSYSWEITSADEGTHSWTAKAYDAAGNTEVSSPVVLTVDILP